MANDVIKGEILADGTIRSTTGKISGANHQKAEEFLAMVARMMGGAVTRERAKDQHGFTKGHTHEGQAHSH
jgi:hypothetical protein